MLARVLEAGLELAHFNVGALPRGYLKQNTQAIPDDLHVYRSLFVAAMDPDPGLHLMTADSEIEYVGSFLARKLDLHALCAQRN